MLSSALQKALLFVQLVTLRSYILSTDTLSAGCYLFTDLVPASLSFHHGLKLSGYVVEVVLVVVVLVVLGVVIFSSA